MKRSGLAACVGNSAVVAMGHLPLDAAEGPRLAGAWALNRPLSQFPREVGFGMDLLPAGRGSGGQGGEAGGAGACVEPAHEHPGI